MSYKEKYTHTISKRELYTVQKNNTFFNIRKNIDENELPESQRRSRTENQTLKHAKVNK